MGEYLKNKALLYRNFCVRNIIKILERAIMDVLSRKLGIDLSPSTFVSLSSSAIHAKLHVYG